MSHFLWIMKCNLSEQIPKQVSYIEARVNVFLRGIRISRPKLSSHSPWRARREIYKVFFEFIWLVMLYFLMNPFYFSLSVSWLKGV